MRLDRGMFGQMPVHGESQDAQSWHPDIDSLNQQRTEGMH
jgi:hypothetical protein